jgi:hypothetical protein
MHGEKLPEELKESEDEPKLNRSSTKKYERRTRKSEGDEEPSERTLRSKDRSTSGGRGAKKRVISPLKSIPLHKLNETPSPTEKIMSWNCTSNNVTNQSRKTTTKVTNYSSMKNIDRLNVSIQKIDRLNVKVQPCDPETKFELRKLEPNTDIKVVDGTTILPFKITNVLASDELIEGYYYESYCDRDKVKWKIPPGKLPFTINFTDFVEVLNRTKQAIKFSSSRFKDVGVEFDKI